MQSFQDSLDIGNRALFHCGQPSIKSVDEDSTANEKISEVYDKLRQAELRRNLWKFSRKKVLLRPITTTSRLLAPAPWEADETYLPGAIVKDGNGDLWISFEANNVGNEPGVSDAWDSYFGPMAIDAWSDETDYRAGEVVYKPNADLPGAFGIFFSLINANDSDPDTAVAWDDEATYGLNDRVLHTTDIWRSTITLNKGITPADAPDTWAPATSYDTDEIVLARDGFTYTALDDDLVDVDPVDDADGSFWERGVAVGWSRDPNQYEGSPDWLPIFADMKNMGVEWLMVGAGPTSTFSAGNNVFRLPAGYLRSTVTNRRQIRSADDHDPIGDYIVTTESTILLEFGADITDVRKMDVMFCEGLACRIAEAVCEPLTQSATKLASIVAEYHLFMKEARIVNAIEIGTVEPLEDELIAVRR